jgi:Tfp pilus assembly protein PilE
MTRTRRHTRGSGFTLVETIATITILVTLGSISSGVLWSALDAYSDAAVRAALHSETSVGMERIIRELHGIDKKAVGVAPEISDVTPTSITWNTSNSITLSGDQVLLVDGGGPARVLLDEVTTLTIQTYDESDAAMASSLSGAACDAIRRISVEVTLQREGVTETLRTKMFVRCTMAGAAP